MRRTKTKNSMELLIYTKKAVLLFTDIIIPLLGPRKISKPRDENKQISYFQSGNNNDKFLLRKTPCYAHIHF